MKELHNLGSFENLERVWDIYPHGACAGDYVILNDTRIYWDDERRVWGKAGDDVSSEVTQRVEGNLIVDKDLIVGGGIKGNSAKFKELIIESLEVENPPYAMKKHKHSLQDIIGADDGIVIPGKIEYSKHADYADKADVANKAFDLYNDSPVNERFLRKDQADTTDFQLSVGSFISKGLMEANNGLVVRKTEAVEPMLIPLLSEEFEDSIVEESEDVFIEEVKENTPSPTATTLGELINVNNGVDNANSGSLLVKGETEWWAVPPVISTLTDYNNAIMPIFHQTLGKWVFISVTSINGGTNPPTVLDLVLDTGILDVNKLA